MSEDSGHVLRIERSFPAAAEEVFDAWTSPEVMRRWFHAAPEWDTAEAEVDLRVGGKVRVVMRRPDGTHAEMWGEYTLIDRPRRLVMAWTFGEDPANEQLVELSFTRRECPRTARGAWSDAPGSCFVGRTPGGSGNRPPRPI